MIKLDEDTRAQLRQIQRREKDRRRLIKITVVLMLDGGFTAEQIAFTFGIDASTVYRYAEIYQRSAGLGDYIQDKYVHYTGKLTAEQIDLLQQELRSRLYRTASEVASFIAKRWGIRYASSSLVALLDRIGFAYKKTTQVPSKADRLAQQAFLHRLAELLAHSSPTDYIYYSDAVHPQHNTRASYGWIARGEQFHIKSNTARERLNINAAINAFDVSDIVVRSDARIDGASTIALYEQLQQRHRSGRIIVICDNARYYHSRAVKEWLETSRVEQVFLPSYSPNLNLIERLWKFMRKQVIDAEYYPTKELFREAVMGFFRTIKQYRSELESLLTLNFQILGFSQTN
jgi:transposase